MDEPEKAVRMGLKQGFKNITKDLLCYMGGPNFLWRSYSNKRRPCLLVFDYHRVYESAETMGYLGMPMDIFEQQAIFIKNNFKVMPAAEALRLLHNSTSKEIYAAINFDDGYMDNYLYAFPVLKKYNVPATVFLATDAIGKRHAFWWDNIYGMMAEKGVDRESAADALNKKLVERKEEEIMGFIESMKKGQAGIDQIGGCQMLGWPEIKEMGNYNITFGGHTKTHKNLCILEDDEARAELAESKAMIEKNTGVKVREFSYPFGKFNERVRSLVIEAGYECARTTLKGINDKNTDRYSLVSIDTGGIAKARHLEMRMASILLKGGPKPSLYT